ncbi:glycoside hydrolase family 5 protein [Coniella lustricola]|uniref:Glycoside hydrolase family 5 protein n=1 Tax=Coniella lustricola TaxID=2025994 RepID=A0A2T3AMV1_9PEZI|nr:glycoside hydrolase family 5 protein [Coniella lustricola]
MLSLRIVLLGLLTLLACVQGTAPSLPLSTSSRWILDSTGARVKLRCVNWAGHLEAHVPEGLHKQSIGTIAQFIAEAGFNCVRLTYSIDWALNPDETVQDAFSNAAELAYVPSIADNMTAFYNMIVTQNPSLATATVRDVYGDVIDALWANGVMTILDNHVSRAQWCCNLTDGNGWWDTAFGYVADNSRFFNTSEWLEGLQAVAAWAPSHAGVVGMSLRNEIRQSWLQGTNGPYADWYTYITQGAQTVHTANPDVLVIVGGGYSATDLTMLRDTQYLDFTPWAGKHVWEFHAYSFTVTFDADLGLCSLEQDEYGLFDGFVLTGNENYTAPLLLSEFGVDMTGGTDNGLSDDDASYLSCLVGYMENNDAEWALWAVQGSYYVRNGVVDYNETWGVLDFDWATWRNPEFAPLLGTMWNITQGP